MTPREAYKFGFLCRCVEEGLDPYQTQTRIQVGIEKKALSLETVSKLLGVLGNAGKSTAQLAVSGFPAAALVGATVGGGLGTGLAHLERKELDEDEIRRRELIDTYNLFADRALAKAKPQQAIG